MAEQQQGNLIPPEILAMLDYATCPICGETVMTKGGASHVVCSLARITDTYSWPVTFIAGKPNYADPEETPRPSLRPARRSPTSPSGRPAEHSTPHKPPETPASAPAANAATTTAPAGRGT